MGLEPRATESILKLTSLKHQTTRPPSHLNIPDPLKILSIHNHLHSYNLSLFFGCNCRQASSKAQAILCEHIKNVIFHITRKQRATLSWHIIITEWQHFFCFFSFSIFIFFAAAATHSSSLLLFVCMNVHGGWKIYVFTFYYSMWNDKCLLPLVLHELINFFLNESEGLRAFSGHKLALKWRNSCNI